MLHRFSWFSTPESDGTCTLRYQGSSRSVWLSLLPIACAKHAAGVAADISHVNTKSKVTEYQLADDGLKHALTGASLVFILAVVA